MPGGDSPEFQTLYEQGQAARLAGDLDSAAELLTAAVTLQPTSVPALMEMGLTHQLRQSWPRARGCFELVLKAQPDNAQVLDALGRTCQAEGNLDQAIAHWQRAVKLDHHYASAWQNLALAHEHADQFPEAIACHRQTIALQPNNSKAHRLLGAALLDHGLLPDARQAIDRAFELAPNDPEAVWHRFVHRAFTGDFPGAWEDYECRCRLKNRTTPDPGFTQPRWTGEPMPGQTLLLHAEQGYGDTLQMIRYAPLVAQRASRVLLWIPAALEPLLADTPGITQVTTVKPAKTEFDAHLPLMSLPGTFGHDLQSIPNTTPYLGDFPKKTPNNPKKIGLVWTGSGTQPIDRRSLSLTNLAPLFAVENLQWHSLQPQSTPADQLIDHTAEITDFAATAKLMVEMDLVISVDTAAAHLAAALGLPVWVLLNFAPDWRWGREGESSPWYPSARLVRQSYGQSWTEVAEDLAVSLRELPAP